MSSEKLTAMLKERLEATRKELQEQSMLKEEMEADLLTTREDLKTARIQNKQDQFKMNEVRGETLDNNLLHSFVNLSPAFQPP